MKRLHSCFAVLLGVLMITVLAPRATAQGWTDWSATTNLGTAINSPSPDGSPAISKDGLRLIFLSGRARTPNYGGRDLWVAQRASVEDPWSAATVVQNLGSTLNSSGHEQEPAFSPDEHRLYFASDRSGGFGGFDIYVSRRHNRRDDFGWQQPVNVGGNINTPANEDGPALYEDEATGKIYLYFVSDRNGSNDIFVSELQPDDTFAPAEPVPDINSAVNDFDPFVSRDGLELYLGSNRPGYGMNDVWVSRREITSDPWPEPVNLGPLINSSYNEHSPTLSFDGAELYLMISFNPGNVPPVVPGPFPYDIWVATREKVKME